MKDYYESGMSDVPLLPKMIIVSDDKNEIYANSLLNKVSEIFEASYWTEQKFVDNRHSFSNLNKVVVFGDKLMKRFLKNPFCEPIKFSEGVILKREGNMLGISLDENFEFKKITAEKLCKEATDSIKSVQDTFLKLTSKPDKQEKEKNNALVVAGATTTVATVTSFAAAVLAPMVASTSLGVISVGSLVHAVRSESELKELCMFKALVKLQQEYLIDFISGNAFGTSKRVLERL